MKNNSLLIIGDSLSAHRKENDQLIIWPELINTRLGVSYRNLSKPFQVSSILSNIEANEDQLILNLGLVDCAERSYSRFETKLFRSMPNIISNQLKGFLNRKPSIDRCYVNCVEFKENYSEFLARNVNKRILIISILPSCHNSVLTMVTKSQIKSYNAILSELSVLFKIDFLNTSEMTDKIYYLDDGYHLSQLGHEFLARRVIEWIGFEN